MKYVNFLVQWKAPKVSTSRYIGAAWVYYFTILTLPYTFAKLIFLNQVILSFHRCPYAGCGNAIPLIVEDLEENRELKEYIRRKQSAAH